MSNEPTVVIRNVIKEYSSESLEKRTSSRFGRRRRVTVRALDDINLVASAGESIGVLGRNGSGKSTLLSLISGAEGATQGEVLVRSQPTLLGVSAALQNQLSGVENVKLGCLAMGMERKDLDGALEDILEFTELGNAIYRPLHTYSSGMAARLKFAISTSIRPEILLVDEALSTGDAAFAAKAKDRMESLLNGDGTVFLVSHGAGQIQEMCTRAVWLYDGEIIADGPSEEVAGDYQEWAKLVGNGEVGAAQRFIEAQVRAYQRPVIILDSEAEDLLNILE